MDATPHERLERATWDPFWVPADATVIDRPELFAIHVPRPLHYLNCVYRVRARAARTAELVREVCTLHGDGASRWQVASTVDTTALCRELATAGYAAGHVHDARVIAVDEFMPRPGPDVVVRRVVDERTLRDCWRVFEGAFEQDGDYTDSDVSVELALCAAPGARVQRYVAYAEGEPVSSGGVNVYPSLGFGFLWAGGTVPAARGKGAYSAVVAARVARAAELGLAFVGTYARASTSSPIFAAQGFDTVGQMTYWERG